MGHNKETAGIKGQGDQATLSLTAFDKKKQEQGSKVKRNYIQGRLNNVDMTTTHGAKEVVYGFILVNSAPAIVMFDPRASHSFISSQYVEDHKITMLSIRKPVMINSLGGEVKANHILPKS